MKTSIKIKTNPLNQELTLPSRVRVAHQPLRNKDKAVPQPTREKANPAQAAIWIRGTAVKGNPAGWTPQRIPEITYQRTGQTMF
jgi:hypothetical protein